MKPVATDLEQAVRSSLAAQHGGDVLIAGGPAVLIDPRALGVLAVALREYLHEVAASASVGQDREVAVTWSCDDEGCCIVELDEIGKPRPGTRMNGIGMPLEQSSAFRRAGDGMVRFELSDRGARIIIPARYVAGTGITDHRRVVPVAPSPDPLVGRSVLVVEDQLIIALDLEAMLREQGAAEVHLCGSAEDALKCLASDQPDVAILDVNLGATTSIPVARELQRLRVPFIFATGYGNEVEFPRELTSVPLVGKPYCIETMRQALLTIVMAHA